MFAQIVAWRPPLELAQACVTIGTAFAVYRPAKPHGTDHAAKSAEYAGTPARRAPHPGLARSFFANVLIGQWIIACFRRSYFSTYRPGMSYTDVTVALALDCSLAGSHIYWLNEARV